MKDDSAPFRPEEAGDNAQQSGLSRSISARKNECFAGCQVKGNINENEIVTAPCGQTFGGEMHASALSSFRLRRGQKMSDFDRFRVWQVFTKLSIRPATTPAVGVNFILAPNLERLFHVRTAEMAVPAS
ncbi:hypothetical protein GGI59_003699 [Rhizobium lentis]|uniref:Uncharacterized protein n=1 Tax=Rhizobium lentis TaxID=1138194 RepID=A0A7W9CVU6_9HYPH|nr:hypothetical protein [Rhizobium lentis]MBB5562020.1 hypothetical protein [Rhizobium lentis]MBB5568603.1 hypothetical protein [Rhizobium lentis]